VGPGPDHQWCQLPQPSQTRLLHASGTVSFWQSHCRYGTQIIKDSVNPVLWSQVVNNIGCDPAGPVTLLAVAQTVHQMTALSSCQLVDQLIKMTLTNNLERMFSSSRRNSQTLPSVLSVVRSNVLISMPLSPCASCLLLMRASRSGLLGIIILLKSVVELAGKRCLLNSRKSTTPPLDMECGVLLLRPRPKPHPKTKKYFSRP
jgi:hypothetical protein